ncbi:MAG: metallophosphoesterase family protein [Bacillota bacterium]
MEKARILCCSDIHGHAEAFRGLLRAARWRPGEDSLILLGDYIDRGPDSRRVVAEVKTLLRCPGVFALRGNHEQMLADYLDGTMSGFRYLANGGDATLAEYRDDEDALLRDAAFLKRLPLYHETEEYIFVHAGLMPGVPLRQQSQRDMLWIRDEFIRGYRGKTVVFGHTPTPYISGEPGVYLGRDKIGIDTGVAYGGHLSMLELDSKQVYTARGDRGGRGGLV